MAVHTTAAHSSGQVLPFRASLLAMFGISFVVMLVALDQTVVGTALPKIITDLHGNALYNWVVVVYLLTSTISGPIYGKLSDLFGRRPIILWAVSLFIISSILAGLSQEMWQLSQRSTRPMSSMFCCRISVAAPTRTPCRRRSPRATHKLRLQRRPTGSESCFSMRPASDQPISHRGAQPRGRRRNGARAGRWTPRARRSRGRARAGQLSSAAQRQGRSACEAGTLRRSARRAATRPCDD